MIDLMYSSENWKLEPEKLCKWILFGVYKDDKAVYHLFQDQNSVVMKAKSKANNDMKWHLYEENTDEEYSFYVLCHTQTS